MTTLRHRMTIAALTLLAVGVGACSSDQNGPLDPTGRQRVSADVDTSKKAPTIPWTDVNSAAPTIPWN